MDGTMRKKIICFGTKFDLIEKLKACNYEPILVNFIEPFDIFIDYQDAIELKWDRTKFTELTKESICGVVVVDEYFVELGQVICKELFPELPYLDPKTAETMRDKLLLKKRLAELEIPTSKHYTLKEETIYADLQSFFKKRFLIKPRKNSSARGIRLIERQRNWDLFLTEIDDIKKYFAEEYIETFKEYCCDTIVYRGNVVAQFTGEYTTPCLESFHKQNGIGVLFPGNLSDQKIDEMKKYVNRFITENKIEDAFGHIEFFYSTDGWKFGEIGCSRLPGGYQLPTESYLYGKDIGIEYIKMFDTCLDSIQIPSCQAKQYVGYYLFPRKPGKVKSITADFDHEFILESDIYAKQGEWITYEESSVAASGVVVFEGESRKDLADKMEMAKTLLKIEYA